jgi:hypothetical protein
MRSHMFDAGAMSASASFLVSAVQISCSAALAVCASISSTGRAPDAIPCPRCSFGDRRVAAPESWPFEISAGRRLTLPDPMYSLYLDEVAARTWWPKSPDMTVRMSATRSLPVVTGPSR